MNKIIIVLCAVLAVAYAENSNLDNYVKVNSEQHRRTIGGYDSELARFKSEYLGRVEAVSEKKEFVFGRLIEIKESFSSLQLLSGLHKQCVAKYSERIEKIQPIKESYTKCEVAATSQVSIFLEDAVKLRDELENYLKENFNGNVVACQEDTVCVRAAVSNATQFAYENQKSFRFALEAADCLAKANVKKVVDCTYSIEYNLLTTFGGVTVLIDRCIGGDDECVPCQEHTCDKAVEVYGDTVNQTIENPIYGREDNPKCLMLKYFALENEIKPQ